MAEYLVKINKATMKQKMAEVERLVEWGVDAYPSVEVAIRQELRSNDQNNKMWPMLTDISRQVTWHGKKYRPDDWKEIITGSWNDCEFLPNTENTGFVVIGLSTSKLSKKRFSSLIEFIYAFGTTQGVKWSEQSKETYENYREKENNNG